MKKTIKNLFKCFSGTQKEPYEEEKKLYNNLEGLQQTIGYSFKDPCILARALTHTSFYYNSDVKNVPVSEYERMEFLGDSILGLVTAEYLYSKYTDKKEGFLSKLKSQVVSENYLSVKAKHIDLGKYIILGDEEYKDRGYQKKSILSNMMESLICAVYLDGGYMPAKQFILTYILKDYKEELNSDVHINYKSTLQEYCQSKYKQLPVYKVISTEGPDHKKVFSVTVFIQGKKIGTGGGFTKKTAEQEAAKEGCAYLNI